MVKWRYRSTILNIGTRRWVVSFTPRSLYPRGNSPRYPLNRKLGGPQSRSESWEVEKISAGNWTSVVQPVACGYTGCAVPVYRKANSCSSSQKTPNFTKLISFFSVLKGTSLDHILSLSIPVHIFLHTLLLRHGHSVINSPALALFKPSLFFRCSAWTSATIPSLVYV
jgi:hypothetical protein